MYQFRTLRSIGMPQLASCFNLAFSDYEQPICFTPEALKHYLAASAVELSLSFGAFCDEELVAFILNSSGTYNGEQVVFDAGTGVVPGHRGKKVFSGLFEYTCGQLREHNINRYYLEVLQTNHHAATIYSKKGFSIRREYAVLTASGIKDNRDHAVLTVPYGEFAGFSTRFSAEPSFEHTSYTIDQNPQLYEVRCIPEEAYCIYAKRNGEINQLHYNDLDALKEVLSSLISRYPSAMAKNIDCDCYEVIGILRDLGFCEIARQYEMVKDI